jgi:D-serine deaminase-like pyridoxal phosphate-dependent protein
VAAALGGLALSRPTRVVLRSGCYLTHDHAHYAELSPLSDRLRPALELWAEVISRPEDGLAILCFGKRDAPYDLELPIPLAVRRRARGLEPVERGRLTVRELDDQHAYVDVDGIALEVGDLVGLGISHPCTAFDKWRLLPLVDEDYRVTGGIRTFF